MSKRDHLKYLGFATAAAIATSKIKTMTQSNELPASTQERIKADAKAYMHAEIRGMVGDDEITTDSLSRAYIAGATAENARFDPVLKAAEKVAKIFAHNNPDGDCAICELAKALQQWKQGKEAVKAKDGIIRLILSGCEEVSKDAESAEEYLKSEGVNIAEVKENARYIAWKAELIKLTKEKTGESVVRINDTEARKWFDDDYTPEQTFRENWQSDGD